MMHDDFVNAVLENTPEHYDGDDSGEAIAIRYVRDLEALLTASATVMGGLGCNHVHDSECARCQWLRPFKEAVWTLTATWPDEAELLVLDEDLEQEREYRRQVEDDNRRLRQLLRTGLSINDWDEHRFWCRDVEKEL